MKRRWMASLLLAGLPAIGWAVPFWGAQQSSPLDTPPAALKPGEFVWDAGAVPSGPIVVLVSLDEQRAYVYRNGIEIGYTTVSTGRKGHETPTGIFTILQKDKDHHSDKYNNAAMPYQERLTWDGVALHAGGLPGYPSSHGCVHLPSAFARDLFEISPMGMTVVVADSSTQPADVDHPPALAPVSAATGTEVAGERLSEGEAFRFEPDKSPTGPVSLLMSGADRRVIVLRNGVEIGRARLTLIDEGRPLGSHAYILKEPVAGAAGVAPAWVAVSVPGYSGQPAGDTAGNAAKRVDMPDPFATRLQPLLVPGTTLFITDAPVLEQNSGAALTVVTADPQG